MRWTMGFTCLLVLATTGWAQDVKTLRAYGMEFNQFRGQDREFEAGAFQLLGTGMPIDADPGKQLWLEEPDTSCNTRDLAPDLIRAIAEGIEVIDGGDTLLIEATDAQHRIIKRTLALLRAQQELGFEIEHLVLPREMDKADRGFLVALSEGTLGEKGWSRLRALDRYRGARRGTIDAVAGEWVRYEATRRVAYLSDYNAEIAQGASVPDPIMKNAYDGVRMALRAFPLTDGRVVVRMVASAGQLDDDLRRFSLKARELADDHRMRDSNYGEVELAQYRGMCVATETVLSPGARAFVVMDSTEHESDEVHVLALSLKHAGQPSGESTVALLPIGALTNQHGDWRLSMSWGGQPKWNSEGEKFGPRLAEKALSGLAGDDEVLWNATDLLGGSLLMQAPPARIAGIRKRLARLEQMLLRPVRLSMQFHVIADGGTRPQGMVNQPALLGTPTVFGSYRRFDYIGDHDVEVAQQARIADPLHKVAVAGILGDATITATAEGQYRVRLALNISSAGKPEEVRPKAGGVGPLERVRRTVLKLFPTIRLAEGKSRTIDLGANPYGEGRLTVDIR